MWGVGCVRVRVWGVRCACVGCVRVRVWGVRCEVWGVDVCYIYLFQL